MREQHAVNAELKSSELLSAYGRKRNGRNWWKAASPLSGSDRRKLTFVQKAGQGAEGPVSGGEPPVRFREANGVGRRSFRQPGRGLSRPYLVEAGTATFEQRPKVSGRSLAQLRRWPCPPRNSVSKSGNCRCTEKCLPQLRAEGKMSHHATKLCAGQINRAPVETGLAAPHAVSQLRHPSSIS
jgi:hypothetical protein